jgi:hypothetical protein
LRLASLPPTEAAAALAAAPPAVPAVLARWTHFCNGFGEALRTRLAAILSSAEYARAPSSSAVADELERVLALHCGLLVGCDASLPAAWHLSATAGALVACPALVRGGGGGSRGGMSASSLRSTLAALSFVREFVSPEFSLLRRMDTGQAEAVLGAVAALFRAFDETHAAKLRALAANSAAVAAAAACAAASSTAEARRVPHTHVRTSAAASRLARLDEEELAEAVRLQLNILERLLETEDTAFIFAPAPAPAAAGGSDANGDQRLTAAATQAVVTGLGCLLPLLTPGSALLQLPSLAASYLAVVGGLICGHPQQVARVDAGLFAALIAALEFGAGAGVGAANDDLVDEALRAVQTLASHHASCRSRGFAPPLTGLQDQLAAARAAGGRCLWARLLLIILGVLVGPRPPPRSVIPAASDALGAVIAADPAAFAANVQQLLAAQADAGVARALGAEFSALTAGVPADGASLNRSGRISFRARVETFVENARRCTTLE